jgi:hypothetical protein
MSEAAKRLATMSFDENHSMSFDENHSISHSITYERAVEVIDFVLEKIRGDLCTLDYCHFLRLFDYGEKYGPDQEPLVKIEKDQYGNYRITPSGNMGPWLVDPECFNAIREWEEEE